MAQNKDSSGDVDFDSQNIFDEFSESQEIWDEIQRIDKQQEKDVFFYLKKSNSFIFFLNVMLFLGICVFIAYSYVQTQEKKTEYSFLSPICSLFLGNIDIEGNTCYGVNPILIEYGEKLENLKKQQAEMTVPILWEIYSIENFNLSKKVSFLLEKTNTRLRPLEILTAFDSLKSRFASIDKKELRCYDISIESWNIMNVTCDAFSPDWDTSIVDLRGGDTIESVAGWGTSISRASSFIYFLENHSDSNFQILEKPNSLSKQEIQELPYTQKTTIQLKLRYSDSSILSF